MDLLASDARIQYETFIRGEEEIKKDQGKYMKEISAYPELLDISKSIQIYGYLRSYRIDVVHKAFVRIFPAVYEIMKRLELEEQDFKNLTSEEIRIGLLDPKNSKHQEIVRERKQGSSSFIIGDELIELSGADMAKLSSLIKLKEEKITGIVRGSTAYPGKITAPCKVLFHLEDMKKVNKGDIMVISMTDPNYIPAMDRAAAFVTDQGGILCHAAIVSREMKKPCIIGTKIATKSFKDGDILEVDADNGVVTKL
jgi:phosphohistidine swiveling domain-containing protein